MVKSKKRIYFIVTFIILISLAYSFYKRNQKQNIVPTGVKTEQTTQTQQPQQNQQNEQAQENLKNILEYSAAGSRDASISDRENALPPPSTGGAEGGNIPTIPNQNVVTGDSVDSDIKKKAQEKLSSSLAPPPEKTELSTSSPTKEQQLPPSNHVSEAKLADLEGRVNVLEGKVDSIKSLQSKLEDMLGKTNRCCGKSDNPIKNSDNKKHNHNVSQNKRVTKSSTATKLPVATVITDPNVVVHPIQENNVKALPIDQKSHNNHNDDLEQNELVIPIIKQYTDKHTDKQSKTVVPDSEGKIAKGSTSNFVSDNLPDQTLKSVLDEAKENGDEIFVMRNNKSYVYGSPEEINTRTSSASSIVESGNKAIQKMNVANKEVKAKILAVVPGRAYFVTDDNRTILLSVGDRVPGYNSSITKINDASYSVLLENGEIILLK